jgi:hypothetical protein
MNLSENTFSKDQANLKEQEYVPQQLKMPLVKDFMQVVRDDLVGKRLLVNLHGGGGQIYQTLDDVLMNANQLILKFGNQYVPWSSVRDLTVKSS